LLLLKVCSNLIGVLVQLSRQKRQQYTLVAKRDSSIHSLSKLLRLAETSSLQLFVAAMLCGCSTTLHQPLSVQQCPAAAAQHTPQLHNVVRCCPESIVNEVHTPVQTSSHACPGRVHSSGVHSSQCLNTHGMMRAGRLFKFVVQLLHMSQPVVFSLSRPARAARTSFFPYCSQMYETNTTEHAHGGTMHMHAQLQQSSTATQRHTQNRKGFLSKLGSELCSLHRIHCLLYSTVM
jgi:hypothetical protein